MADILNLAHDFCALRQAKRRCSDFDREVSDLSTEELEAQLERFALYDLEERRIMSAALRMFGRGI